MTGLSDNMSLVRQLVTSTILIGALVLPGCRCTSDMSDEERLKKKIDAASVHIYVGIRVTIADSGKDANARAVRDEIARLLSMLDGQSQPDDTHNTTAKLTWGEFGAMAKQIPQLKARGARVVRGESPEENPALPGLLKIMQVDSPAMTQIDVETDHGIFYMVLSALSAYGAAPVPKKVLLYEAWRTDPEKFKYKGFQLPLHTLKSWTYGSNNFCDLSLKEARASEKKSVDTGQFLSSLEALGITTESAAGLDKKNIEASLRAIAFGSVSWCHIARGNDKEARPHLRRFIDYAKKTNLGPNQHHFEAMEVYYLCGGDEASVAAGKKKLVKLNKSNVFTGEQHGILSAWCDAASESDSDSIRRLLFSGAIVQLTTSEFGQWLSEEKLKELPITQSVEGVTELLTKADGMTGNVTNKVKDWNPFKGDDTGE